MQVVNVPGVAPGSTARNSSPGDAGRRGGLPAPARRGGRGLDDRQLDSAVLRGIDPLMLVQQMAGQPSGRATAVKRGERLLATLGQIHAGRLDGTSTSGVLAALQSELAAERPLVHDPGLAAILDAIDLRAAVEAAKIEADEASGPG